jgi:hypothetical protein
MDKEFFQRYELKEERKAREKVPNKAGKEQGKEKKKCEDERKIGLFSVSG